MGKKIPMTRGSKVKPLGGAGTNPVTSAMIGGVANTSTKKSSGKK